MTRQFDPEMINALAGKISELKGSYTQVGTDLGDGDPGDAYGELKNAASAGTTMKGFYKSVNNELSAAGRLVEAASQALTQAATDLQNDEDEGVRTFGGTMERQ
jgi:hypothetical protein